MKINLKVRFKNPMFYVQLGLSILTPVLTYLGLSSTDLTTWEKLGDVLAQAFSNPYVLSLVAVSVYNALVDPTTKGFGDSENALTYNTPKEK
jgi:phi LC3 family holin